MLQAIWDHSHLHLLGFHSIGAEALTTSFEPLQADELRTIAISLFDELLVAAAQERRMELSIDGFDTSVRQQLNGNSHADSRSIINVPTLRLEPDDAIDALWQIHERRRRVTLSDSVRFWVEAGQLVRQLLSQQMFVPSVLQQAGASQARWRAVLTDSDSMSAAQLLASSIPTICRGFSEESARSRGQELVASFILETVDATIRRVMAGDELTHALVSSTGPESPVQTRWLRALVEPEAIIDATFVECDRLREVVNTWLGRLAPETPKRYYQTGLVLQEPDENIENASERGLWRLSLQLISKSHREAVIDASELTSGMNRATRLLDDSLEREIAFLRSDMEKGARFFPPLGACTMREGPFEVLLSLSEAYSFLRDAASLLRSEGFSVTAPSWWGRVNARPRMYLSLRPSEENSSANLETIHLDELICYDWRVALGDDDFSNEELTLLAKSKEPLVQVRGRWVEVEPAEIAAARAFIEQQGSGSTTLFDALRRCYMADEIASGLTFGGLRATGWIGHFLNASEAQVRIEEVPVPGGFAGELRPYQQRGLHWLAFMSRIGIGACLADDMGLGKTIQLIALLLHENEGKPSKGPTLLVCPMSLVGNWQREIERFGPSLKTLVHHGLERLGGEQFVERATQSDVVISTYSLAHRDFEHLSKVHWRRVALDEAQCIKNSSAKQAQAVRMLQSVHRVALTGTPVENRLSELWSIMDFLNAGYLGTAADFRRRLAIPIERYQDAERADRLRTLIRPFVLRRLKSDPLVQVDLPPKMEMRVFCNLTREQAALYEAVVNEMMRQVNESEGIKRRGIMLATLTKLKQVCNHPVHFLGDGSSLEERSGKCARLTEMLSEVIAEGDSALVFTQYKEMGDLLVKLLQRELGDGDILFLHGGTDRPGRDELVARFQSRQKPTAFVLSLKAGGFGLNLTAAAHVFHFDRWWNPAVEDQATDRAHRIGQDRTVQVHKFVCIGTLEERIDALLDQKRRLADRIIGTGESWLTELSTEQFRELIALSQEAVSDE